MRYSARGWLIVGAVVGAVEYFAPPNDMLSHGVDSALEHPIGKIVVPVVTLITVGHLLNYLNEAYDPYSRAFAVWKREAPMGGMMNK